MKVNTLEQNCVQLISVWQLISKAQKNKHHIKPLFIKKVNKHWFRQLADLRESRE